MEDVKSNELKIVLYPEKEPRYDFPKTSVKDILPKDTLGHSFNENQSLAFLDKNVPLLNGFYTAHINHYPIRIKPDDIWLLIVQAFSHHVNANSEELRNYFVDFSGKKELIVKSGLVSIQQITKKDLENFSIQINEQMKNYLGEEILDLLTPNFTTTTYDSTIVSKISIMGAFKKYFDYKMMLLGCGIPYIILEGESEDYKKIKDKARKLSKYDFDWYINRIIPHIQKMIEAKEGKIDVEYFKNIIQKKEATETRYRPSGGPYGVIVDHISGWFLHFFAYYNEIGYNNKIKRFEEESIKVENLSKLANQMLVVPFKIVEVLNNNKEYLMKYKVGFVGCDSNEKKEVIPVQGWIVCPSDDKERKDLNVIEKKYSRE